VAIFFIFISRKTDDDKEEDECLNIDHFDSANHEEYTHSTKDCSLFTYRPRVRAVRLNEAEVACARQQRLKEIHMWTIISQIITHLCYFSLLCVVIYSNRNENTFLQVNHLRKFFLNTRQIDYTKV
jgi:hypothetical protein